MLKCFRYDKKIICIPAVDPLHSTVGLLQGGQTLFVFVLKKGTLCTGGESELALNHFLSRMSKMGKWSIICPLLR
jgi:hypothetical protein